MISRTVSWMERSRLGYHYIGSCYLLLCPSSLFLIVVVVVLVVVVKGERKKPEGQDEED